MQIENENLIFTIMIGNDPAFPFVEKCFAEYAKRTNADLYVLREEKIFFDVGEDFLPFKKAWLQKFYINELLKKYKRVLYLDGDIIINSNAPNIFEEFPDQSKSYLFNESDVIDRTENNSEARVLLGVPPAEQEFYFNVGVMLISRKSNFLQNWKKDELLKLIDVNFVEQTYMNYLIYRDEVPIIHLPHTYNRMIVSGAAEKRFDSYFIHHAGAAYSKMSRLRYQTMINDYCRIYDYKLTLKEKAEVFKKSKRIFIRRLLNRIRKKLPFISD